MIELCTFPTSSLSLYLGPKPMPSFKKLRDISFLSVPTSPHSCHTEFHLSPVRISLHVFLRSHHSPHLFLPRCAGHLYFVTSSTIPSQCVLGHAPLLATLVSPSLSCASYVSFTALLKQSFYRAACRIPKTQINSL